jgi:hypothetical protein
MPAFAVITKRKAWIEIFINVYETPEDFIIGRIRDLVSFKDRFSSLLRIPMKDLHLGLQFLTFAPLESPDLWYALNETFF